MTLDRLWALTRGLRFVEEAVGPSTVPAVERVARPTGVGEMGFVAAGGDTLGRAGAGLGSEAVRLFVAPGFRNVRRLFVGAVGTLDAIRARTPGRGVIAF